MMPITAGFLEPLGESVPLGIYASWSAYYLFGINPYLWFIGHWFIWLVFDFIQLKGVQVRSYSKLGQISFNVWSDQLNISLANVLLFS